MPDIVNYFKQKHERLRKLKNHLVETQLREESRQNASKEKN